MNNNNVAESKKRTAIKIIVPVVIICTIVAIWLFKGADAIPPESEDGNPDFSLDVAEEIDLEKLKAYGLPIIIDFGADSCVPCKEMAPVLQELNSSLRGKAIIRFVDVWKYPDLSRGFPVEVIPTQILIDSSGKPYLPGNAQVTGLRKYVSKDTEEHIFTAHQGGLTKEQMLAILEEMGIDQ